MRGGARCDDERRRSRGWMMDRGKVLEASEGIEEGGWVRKEALAEHKDGQCEHMPSLMFI